jgi:hypothetical protein
MRQCRQGQAARTAFQSAEDRPKAVQPPHRQQMSCGASLAVAPAAHSPWPRPWRGVYHSHKGWRLPLASRQVNCASPREIVCRQVPWLYWWEALVSLLSWAKPQPWRQPLGAWLHQKRTGADGHDSEAFATGSHVTRSSPSYCVSLRDVTWSTAEWRRNASIAAESARLLPRACLRSARSTMLSLSW